MTTNNATVFLFERGEFWNGAKEKRVFASLRAAKKHIPASFHVCREVHPTYYKSDISEEWIDITKYKVEA